MPIYEIGVPPATTGDQEINRLLSKAREASGQDWRVGFTVIRGRWPWSSDAEKWRLMIYDSERYEAELVFFADRRREIVAYLLGIIDGANSPAARESRTIVKPSALVEINEQTKVAREDVRSITTGSHTTFVRMKDGSSYEEDDPDGEIFDRF